MNQERILLIDDSANDTAVTRRFLERRGYGVFTALSGEEGLALAEKNVPDLVVVDYRMPGMDGFEVVRRLKADSQLKTIPVLMLTGSDSVQNIVDGLSVGADDYVTKGSDTQVLLARVRALLRMKAYQDQLRRANAQMSRDLKIARRVQQALMPPDSYASPRLSIRSAYIPSETLSGDFYDYFETNGLTYLFVADVSGHGLPAAILVSLLKSYIHTESGRQTSLSQFMSTLNDFLFSVSLPTQFATAQLFQLDGSRKLLYANAAHPPFLLHCRKSNEVRVIEDPSHLLGAMPSVPFEEQAIEIGENDTLFVYTDGLTDRWNATGEYYSIDRISALLQGAGDADVSTLYQRIYDDVSGFATSEEFKDDIAFVLARFH